jgi:adenylate cyclase
MTPQGVSMIEQIMSVGGVRVPFRRSEDWKYDPRTKKFYQLALDSPDHPVWTDPYPWYDAEGLGITCALAVRDIRGQVKGVFTADFRLDRLAQFLRTLQIGRSGRVAVLRPNGEVIADPNTRATNHQRDPLLTAAMAALPRDLSQQHVGDAPRVAFEFDGVRYLAAFETFSMPNLDWTTVILVPERELLGSVRRNTLWTIAIGLLSLILAVVLGNKICARFARPLQLISADLARIGRFEISSEPPVQSSVKEISVVSEAIARMKTSLRSFGRYVPTDIVRELVALGEEAKLGAQSRAITIFFSDIQGFTKMSEAMHPQQLVEALGAYFDAMSQVIHWQQGTLDKFIGDGVLAFFNAPAPLPDHAARACRAALACHAELARLRPRWEAKGWPAFRTRIGLHSAEVLVGNIGTPSRFAYTVIGDGVNLASGLESLNKVYGTGILASETTRDAAGAGFEWRRIDRVAVKGRARVGFVYELLGESAGIPADVLGARDCYESAMDAYARRAFAKAVEGLEKSMTLRPDDHAAKTMLVRARRLLHTPPTDEWDSVYTHAPG